MKLIAGMSSPSDNPSVMSWPAPANGHYENIFIQVFQSTDEPLSIYMGTANPSSDWSLGTSDELTIISDRTKNGVVLTTYEASLIAGGNIAQWIYKHFVRSRIRVKHNDLVNVIANSDGTLTNVIFIIHADFVPYQGSPYHVTRRVSTAVPEATNFGIATSVSTPIALINAYLEVQWSVTDSADLGLNMIFRKFNSEYKESTLTLLDGDLIDTATAQFIGTHNEGLLGSIKLDTVTGLSGKQTLPVGLIRKDDRIAWDFVEIIGDSPTIFIYEVVLKGIVKDRHWSKSSMFFMSNAYADMTMMQSIF